MGSSAGFDALAVSGFSGCVVAPDADDSGLDASVGLVSSLGSSAGFDALAVSGFSGCVVALDADDSGLDASVGLASGFSGLTTCTDSCVCVIEPSSPTTAITASDERGTSSLVALSSSLRRSENNSTKRGIGNGLEI